jgi:uncharacterized membrane protein YkvA (DUF1232 family)
MHGVKSFNLLRKAMTAFKYLFDPSIPLSKKAWILASLLYLISPLDLMPDPMPGIGFIDDIGIVLLVILMMSNRLKKYERDKQKSSLRKRDNPEKKSQEAIDAEYEIIDDE